MDYPYDIVSLVRQKTLSIEAHFIQDKKESPMKVFDGTYSRFTCNIINNGAVYFNIPIEALPGVRVKTDIASKEQFSPKQVASSGTGTGNTGPAFTKRFVSGNLKGKTPIEVLLADPIGGKKTLNDQYTWLRENLSKYPKNQELMDAILDAAKIDITTLEGTVVQTSATIMDILDIGCRPLVRKQRQDGKCFVYEGKVTWDTTKNYPVCVTIKNYYADVKRHENGTLNVNLSTKDTESEITKEFNMTADEWLYCLYSMENARDCFRMLHFNEGYKLSEAAAAEARAAARFEAAEAEARRAAKESKQSA